MKLLRTKREPSHIHQRSGAALRPGLIMLPRVRLNTALIYWLQRLDGRTKAVQNFRNVRVARNPDRDTPEHHAAGVFRFPSRPCTALRQWLDRQGGTEKGGPKESVPPSGYIKSAISRTILKRTAATSTWTFTLIDSFDLMGLVPSSLRRLRPVWVKGLAT